MAAKQANKLDEVAMYMFQAGQPYKATMSATEELVNTTKDYVKQEQESYANDAAYFRSILVVVNLAVIIISMIIAFLVSRNISLPVRQVASRCCQVQDIKKLLRLVGSHRVNESLKIYVVISFGDDFFYCMTNHAFFKQSTTFNLF